MDLFSYDEGELMTLVQMLESCRDRYVQQFENEPSCYFISYQLAEAARMKPCAEFYGVPTKRVHRPGLFVYVLH